MKITKQEAIKDLTQIPWEGTSLATKLWDIGITKVDDLIGKDT
jgi:hypothetical protein